MPELPELFQMAAKINKAARGVVFRRISKSAVTKNPQIDVPFERFTVEATSFGKELGIKLRPAAEVTGKGLADGISELDLVFSMGMSGHWSYTTAKTMPKHSHCQFHSEDGHILHFVDTRRFGRWSVGTFSTDRGPCPVKDFDNFCRNIVDNFHMKIFDKPICELMLNQKYFNGIGNYLRAEILHRNNVPPFLSARDALRDAVEKWRARLASPAPSGHPTAGSTSTNASEASASGLSRGASMTLEQAIKDENDFVEQLAAAAPAPSRGRKKRKTAGETAAQAQQNAKAETAGPPRLLRTGTMAGTAAEGVQFVVKQEQKKREAESGVDGVPGRTGAADLLELCRDVSREVIDLKGFYFNPDEETEEKKSYRVFSSWLRCYNKAKSVLDSGGRTIWYHGELGPLAPKGVKPGRDKTHKSKKGGKRKTKVKAGKTAAAKAEPRAGGKRRKLSPENPAVQDSAAAEPPAKRRKAKKSKKEEPPAPEVEAVATTVSDGAAAVAKAGKRTKKRKAESNDDNASAPSKQRRTKKETSDATPVAVAVRKTGRASRKAK